MGSINKLRLLHQLRKNQWLKTSELEELQAEKLRVIVEHAYENTQFYHKKLKDAGIRPEDIKTVNDLEKLPFTNREDIKNNFPDTIVSKRIDLSKCNIASTSGSSGVSIKVAYDEWADDFSKAVNIRSFTENGLTIIDKWVELTSPEHIVNKKWFQRFGVFSPDYISIFKDIEEQINILKKYNYRVISGHSSSLFLLAKAIQEKDIIGISPELVFGTAELLDKGMRNYIDSVFGVKMVDLFGCVELNRTAWECSEHVGHHMDIDAVVMEFIRDGEHVSAGERGEIVYTGLYNYAMPLIRYAIGDIGILSDETCPCGRGLPLMKAIEGKVMDFIVLPSNKLISPHIPKRVMLQINEITDFKVIQERKDKIVVEVIANDDFSEKTGEKIKEKFKEVLKEDIEILVNRKNMIEREKTGKIKVIESKVSPKHIYGGN